MNIKTLKMTGITLIELMVTITIVGILSALVYPSYADYVRHSHRVDARNSLLNYQIEQEKYRSHNVQYAADFAELRGGTETEITSLDGYYELAISGSSASQYRITATPVGNQARDTKCGTFSVSQNGPDFSGSYANERCWSY